MSRRIIYISLVISIALALRLYVAIATRELPRDDALEYETLATNILSGRGYVGPDGAPTSFRPPLYPLLLAVLYSIFGHSYLVVRIFQACLATLTVLLLYLIGRHIHSEKAGIAAAFFAAIYPSYIILTKFLFTETLFTFLLALSVFLFLKTRCLKSTRTSILLGITLGLLSLTRSSAIALPVIYVALFFPGISKEDIRRASYISAITGLVYLMVLAPWVCRNTAIQGRPVLISTNGGLNFYQAVTPKDGKIFGLVPSDENIEKSNRIANEAERDAFLFSKGVEVIVYNPLLAVKLALMRSLFYWGFFDWEVQKGTEYNYLYGFVLPFFIAGSSLALKKIRQFAILLCVIVYFFLVVFVSQGTVRYRLPTDGYLFIIASSGIVNIVERTRVKAFSLSWISAWFLANCWLFANSDLAKRFFKGLVERLGLW